MQGAVGLKLLIECIRDEKVDDLEYGCKIHGCDKNFSKYDSLFKNHILRHCEPTKCTEILPEDNTGRKNNCAETFI